MSKRAVLIISAVALLLLVIAGMAFLNLNKDSTKPQAEVVTPQIEQPSPSPASTKNSIQGLLSAGKNTTCTFSDPDRNSQGTVYVSNGKFRGDFNSTTAETKSLSHIIQTDGFGYFWTEGSKTGTKMNVEAAKNLTSASASASKPSGQPSQVDLNQEVETNCSDWNVDESKFVVPTDVKFTDLSQMLKNIPTSKAGSTAPKVDVSMCDSIKDASSKAACIKAITAQQ